MTESPETHQNGRVTLALLGLKLDYLIAKVDKIDNQVCVDHDRLDQIETTINVLKWAGGVIGGITVTLLIAWVKQLLGL